MKKKTTTIETTNTQTTTESRQNMEKPNPTFQKQLDGLALIVDDLSRTMRGYNGTDGITQRMARMETSIISVNQKVDELSTLMKEHNNLHISHQSIVTMPISQQITAPEVTADDRPVTLNQLLARIWNDIGKPVFTAVVLFALIELFPKIYIAIFGKP